MKLDRKQKGAGLIGLITIFSAFLTVAFVTVTLLPFYMEKYSVNSSVSSTLAEPTLAKLTKKEIQKTLLKRLKVSSVSRVSANEIDIIKTKTSTRIAVRYDVQTHFIYNIDFLLHFETIEEKKY